MKIHFLGTCAGTEPLPRRRHAAIAMECQDRLYWFDAGESCAYTAHLMGLDLLKVCKIVISHTHMDHVGGLGNLLWYIRKLTYVHKRQPQYGGVDVYIPNMETWEGTMMVLRNTEGNFETEYAMTGTEVKAGLVFDDGIMKVTAYENSHMDRQSPVKRQSFSYIIECEGKRIIYPGDLGKLEDLEPLLQSGECDVLMIETGHFMIDAVYDYCKDKHMKQLLFCHNNKRIINDLEGSLTKVKELFGDKAIITDDGMTITL